VKKLPKKYVLHTALFSKHSQSIVTLAQEAKIRSIRSQSFDRELQHQRCKKLQRHE
jgi:hypothetical protein